MFAVRITTPHNDRIHLVRTWDAALATAREFVGAHNPVDGCSTEPREYLSVSKETFRSSRSTSFGVRQAVVVPVQTTAPDGTRLEDAIIDLNR